MVEYGPCIPKLDTASILSKLRKSEVTLTYWRCTRKHLWQHLALQLHQFLQLIGFTARKIGQIVLITHYLKKMKSAEFLFGRVLKKKKKKAN